MKMPKKRHYPKEIWVGGHPWSLKWKRVLEKSKDGQALDTVGLCDPSDKTLYIKMGLSPEETMDCFIHELLHAIEEEYGIVLSSKKHEVGDRLYKLSEAIVDFILHL